MPESPPEQADDAADRTDQPTRNRRWPVVLGVLLTLALLIRAALPIAIEQGLAWAGPRHLGVAIELDDADLALWRGRIDLHGLTVAAPGDVVGGNPETALFRWDRLGLQLSWLDLLRGRVRLQDVSLAGPRIRIELDAEGNLILPVVATEESTPADSIESSPTTTTEAELGAVADDTTEAELGAVADDTTEAELEAVAEGAAEVVAEEVEETDEGWPILVDALRFSELEFRLVRQADGTEPVFFALETLSLQDLALAAGEIGLGGIALADPEVRIERAFIFRKNPEPEPTEPGEEVDLGVFAAHRIDHFAIEEARFKWITADGPVDVRLGIEADNLSVAPASPFQIALRIGLDEGSAVLDGQLGFNPIRYAGTFSWKDLPLPLLLLAGDPNLAPWLRAGAASGELQVDLRVAGEPEDAVMLSGRVGIAALDVRNPGDPEIALGWSSLDIALSEFHWPLANGATEPGRIALGRVALEAPRILMTQPAPSLETLGGNEPEAENHAEQESSAETTPAALVTVDELVIDRGQISVRDQSVDPPVAAALSDLAVRATALRWPERRARGVRISGSAPTTAPFQLTGSLDGDNGDFVFRLDRLDLPLFEPYAHAAAGYGIARGNASVETEIQARGDRTRIDTDLVLHRLDMSEGSEGNFAARFGLPMNAALALLRDLDGNIKLPVNVVIVPDARTELGPIVLAAFRHALTGALTSPLKFAGFALDTISGGDEDADPGVVAFPPGQLEVSESAGDALKGWGELLDMRPALALAVVGETGDADRDGVAAWILGQRVSAGESLPELEDAPFFARRRVSRALEARARGEAGTLESEDEALLARYVAKIDVPSDRFEAFAAARAAAVRTAMIRDHGVEEARLLEAPPKIGAAPGVRFEIRAASP